jgi:hypothetical protein
VPDSEIYYGLNFSEGKNICPLIGFMINKYCGVWLSFFAIILTAPTCAESSNHHETNALSQWQKTGDLMALCEVAMMREEQGQFQSARAAWQLLKKRAGNQKMTTPEGPSQLTWAQVADFTSHRLLRKINLSKYPTSLTSAQRLQIADGVSRFKQSAPVEQLDLLIAADLDGDAIDELVYIGSNGPLGKRKKNAMGIAKWDGRNYKIVWKNTKPIPFMVHIVDNDGDGWKEVFCGYTPDSDDVATLYFNGQRTMWL